MPSFDRLDRLAGGAVTRLFGEAFLFLPRTRGRNVNTRGGSDPTRTEITVTAELYESFSRADNRAVTASSAANMAEPAGHTTARIRIGIRLSDLPYRPAQGDRVRRVSTGDEFNVAEVRVEADDRASLDLNLIERP